MGKNNKLFEYILLGLFSIFLLIFLTNKLSNEDDYFWHLNTGKYISETGFPETDVFSWVNPEKTWYASSWLWDLITFHLYNISGYGSLTILNILIFGSTFFILYRTLRRLDVSSNLIILMLLMLCYGLFERLTPRPHAITYLFITILLNIIVIYKYTEAKDIKRFYFIPVIFLFWINIHTGFILGIIIYIIFLIDIIIKKTEKRKLIYPHKLKIFLIIFALIILSAFINPYSYNYIIYILRGFEAEQVYKIGEWISPFNDEISNRFYIIIYYLFFFGGLAAIYYAFVKKDMFILILMALLMINSTRAVRYTADLELTGFIFITLSLTHIIKNIEIKSIRSYILESIDMKIVLSFVIAIMIFLISTGKLYENYLSYNRETGIGIDEEFYPVKAMEFVEQNDLKAEYSRIFNTYETGGFLTWTTGMKNFIDSRIAEPLMLNEYDTLYNKVLFYADKAAYYNFDMVVYFEPEIRYDYELMKNKIYSHFADFSNEWKLVYWDDRSYVFIKNKPDAAEIISRYEYKYVTPYNFVFQKPVILNGKTNDRQKFLNEIERMKNTEPSSIYLNAIINDYLK